MNHQTMADVPLLVISDNSSSERRITPSWSISQLRTKLEPVTGIPPSAQRMTYKAPGRDTVPVEAGDEDATLMASFALVPYAELHITDTRPASAKINFNDTSNVDKYVMPVDEYERKTDSVLAWKKNERLGRFNPEAPALERAKLDANAAEIESRGIAVGKRCRVGGDDARRGEIRYVGAVPEIPGVLGAWVGVHLDEPVGKNDGSVGGTRYWGEGEQQLKHGVFVRPERVETGDFPVLDDLDDEDMEEI
ncbi:tubulin-specific chaperone B [Microdochium nivale]|nr:tubulin-specific chaperone B [Microdochium nivale]